MKNIMYFFFAALILFLNCKQYNQEFIGAPLGIATDNFEVVGNSFQPSAPSVNVFNQTMHFQSTFNENVSWTIKLKGRTSSAVKTIKGTSPFLDMTNAIWDGSADSLRLFLQNETIDATLTVFGWSSALTTSFTLAQGRNHGLVLGRFESINKFSSISFQDTYYWFSQFEANEMVFNDTIFDAFAPQGRRAYRINGNDANNSFYIGKLGLSPDPANYFAVGSSVPTDVYFNLFVKGEGVASNGKLVIETFEDDNQNNIQDYTGAEDKYSYEILVNYDGWKLHTIRYSNFSKVSSGGNNSKEPHLIKNIGYFIALNSLSGSKNVNVLIDYPTISVGGPIIP